MIESAETLLSANKLHKSFHNGQQALSVMEGVNISLKRGESLCILGESGSGKSTLLNILSGLEKADSGTLMWKGVSVEDYSLDALAAKRRGFIGFIFQSFHLINEFTVYQNLFLASRIVSNNTLSSTNETIASLLEKVGLVDKLNTSVKLLSGGERQRVAIIRALLNDPDIIFADEPTGNLDPDSSSQIFQMLLDLSEEANKSLIFVTHNHSFKSAFTNSLIFKNKKLTSAS